MNILFHLKYVCLASNNFTRLLFLLQLVVPKRLLLALEQPQVEQLALAGLVGLLLAIGQLAQVERVLAIILVVSLLLIK